MIALVNANVRAEDGTYSGLWSGYEIREVSGEFTLRTEDGCCSMDGMPVTITVSDGLAYVEAN